MLAENIKLDQPLPWHSAAGATGFVTSINPQGLRLRTAQPANFIQITIALPDGHEIELAGQCGVADRGEVLFQVEQKARKVLHDLMNQVRKDQHIEICNTQDVESSDRFTGFSDLQFVPEALPELDFNEIDPSSHFLGRRFNWPILITGMTGGIEKGAVINRRLALAAAELGIPMGIGSQRMALENPDFAPIFEVKKHAPNLFLIGNIGCSQLLQPDFVEQCQRAIAMVNADALAVHVNILQECVQVEGDRHFKGILPRIATLCGKLAVPVIVKEVGCGINTGTATRLIEAGVSAIDVGGRGGTSWGYIEGLRATSSATHELASTFRNWGIPTAFSLHALRAAHPNFPLIATGGIRDGLTVAKAVAVGADMVGVGLPLMRAALISDDEPVKVLRTMARGVSTTMMLTGSRSLIDLGAKLGYGAPYQQQFRSRWPGVGDWPGGV